MYRKLFVLVLLVLALTVGILPTVVNAQEVSCGADNATVNLPSGVEAPILVSEADAGSEPVVPPGGDQGYKVTQNSRWYQLETDGVMSRICKSGDPNAVGWTLSALLVIDQPEPEPTQEPIADAAALVPTLDGDEHICDVEKCSLDVGVNVYDDESDVAQIGFAWGSPLVAWEGHVTDGDKGFVTLMDGWYLDLTLPQGGVERVYNYPVDWTDGQLQQFIEQIKQEAFGGSEGVDYVVWDSEVASLSGSALGNEGTGSGDLYPQLDGQQYSCPPEKGVCIRDIVVADERQIALVFGVQIDYMDLHGATSDDPQESIRLPEFRCEIVALNKGTYNGLMMLDARVEVYTVPVFDQAGWFRNLIGERAKEQSVHYGCPEQQFVPIWNSDGTVTNQYELHWQTDPPAAEYTAVATS